MKNYYTGQDLIDIIQSKNLQDSLITITGLIQRDGDHDCPTTRPLTVNDHSISVGNDVFDENKKVWVKSINFYIADEFDIN